MNVPLFIKQAAQKRSITMAVNKKVDYIHQNPDERIGTAIEALRNLETMVGETRNMSEFADWVERNPGTKNWFTNLFRKDPEIVKKFFLNFLVNVNLKWLKNTQSKATGSYGLSTPYSILISPTMRCNLRCKGCYAGEYGKGDDLPTREVNRIISEGKQLGTFFYTILGGEPLVRWNELYKIMRKHDDCLFRVFTNGTLITDKVADQILKLGNVYPVLSVNGWEEATDEIRGPGAFEQILETAERLHRRGILFGNSFVFMRNNFEDLTSDQFYDFWIEKGSFFAWNFLYMPVGDKPDLECMPTPEQRRRMGDFVRSLRERKPFFLMDFWNDAPAVGGCIAGGRRYLHINHKGDVEPCIFAHFATDNIHDKSLQEVLASDFMTDIRMHQPHSDNLLTPCMIIDNPQILREVVERHQAYSTDGNSNQLLNDYSEQLDNYAAEAHNTLDPVWMSEKYKEKRAKMHAGEGLHSGEIDRLRLAKDPVVAEEVSRSYPFLNEYPWIIGNHHKATAAASANQEMHTKSNAGLPTRQLPPQSPDDETHRAGS